MTQKLRTEVTGNTIPSLTPPIHYPLDLGLRIAKITPKNNKGYVLNERALNFTLHIIGMIKFYLLKNNMLLAFNWYKIGLSNYYDTKRILNRHLPTDITKCIEQYY